MLSRNNERLSRPDGSSPKGASGGSQIAAPRLPSWARSECPGPYFGEVLSAGAEPPACTAAGAPGGGGPPPPPPRLERSRTVGCETGSTPLLWSSAVSRANGNREPSGGYDIGAGAGSDGAVDLDCFQCPWCCEDISDFIDFVLEQMYGDEDVSIIEEGDDGGQGLRRGSAAACSGGRRRLSNVDEVVLEAKPVKVDVLEGVSGRAASPRSTPSRY